RELGSDVPFFLLGGRAVGIGRGTELYPLPDVSSGSGVVVTPAIHVSTAAAYGSLGRTELTMESSQNKIDSFQGVAWAAGRGVNDFEEAVFREHPRLRALKEKLIKFGASPAMMSGSGSSLFGIFGSRKLVNRAIRNFREETVFPI